MKLPTILAAVSTLVLQGCCLDSLNFKPELNAIDLKAAKADSASFGIQLKFKNCCPSKEQKEAALELQKKVAKLFDDVIAGNITIDEYNSKVTAARNTITNVILVCNALEAEKKDSKPNQRDNMTSSGYIRMSAIGSVMKPKTKTATPEDLTQAWDNVRKLNESF